MITNVIRIEAVPSTVVVEGQHRYVYTVHGKVATTARHLLLEVARLLDIEIKSLELRNE